MSLKSCLPVHRAGYETLFFILFFYEIVLIQYCVIFVYTINKFCYIIEMCEEG